MVPGRRLHSALTLSEIRKAGIFLRVFHSIHRSGMLSHSTFYSRRDFLRLTGAAATAAATGPAFIQGTSGQITVDEISTGQRPQQSPDISVVNPRGRVPLSFIIDDSTCLVNMGHFCMPQFANAFPTRDAYKKPWRDWPREIPDDFVREFADWCDSRGVRGKYSVVPYPACVGWVDRFLPGWSQQDLENSLKLVRERMLPHWDIHPEMISHTRVLDLSTGRPFSEVNLHTMENSHPHQPVSVDYLTDYISRALQVLHNVDLPCDGFTTPGGFGNRVKDQLSLGGMRAVREVFNVEVPHYFKYLELDPERSTLPRIEHVSGLGTDDVRCMVNIIAGTGDWFGGWDGVSAGDIDESADRFITGDGSSGRMVEMIRRQEPAIMLCHWPGIFCNGARTGFRIFQKAVDRLNQHYSGLAQWMKLTDIARYYAAAELTSIRLRKTSAGEHTIDLDAPFHAPDFTMRIPLPLASGARPAIAGRPPMAAVESYSELRENSFLRLGERIESALVCLNLPKGRTTIQVGRPQGA